MLTKNNGKPLIIRDVLELGDHDASRFLENSLVAPAGIERAEHSSDSVVLSHPHRVHHGQLGLLVDASVARLEARELTVAVCALISAK